MGCFSCLYEQRRTESDGWHWDSSDQDRVSKATYRYNTSPQLFQFTIKFYFSIFCVYRSCDLSDGFRVQLQGRRDKEDVCFGIFFELGKVLCRSIVEFEVDSFDSLGEQDRSVDTFCLAPSPTFEQVHFRRGAHRTLEMAEDVAGSVGSSFRRYLFAFACTVSIARSFGMANPGRPPVLRLLTSPVRRTRRQRSR